MKTIKEWFETFPEPYRSEAIAEFDKQNGGYKSFAERMYLFEPTLGNAITWAFDWEQTEQGQEYWLKLKSTLTT